MEVLSILISHRHLLHTIRPLPSSSSCNILCPQVLQITERFYQTPLPPIIARGITKQLGSFAPWGLPQFIATAKPFFFRRLLAFLPFPGSAGYGSDLLQSISLWDEVRFLQLRNMPLSTLLPLPPRRNVMSPRSARATPCCLHP